MSTAEASEKPLPPDEGEFRLFVTRLLRVPKTEIDAREAGRERRAPRPNGAKVRPDKA